MVVNGAIVHLSFRLAGILSAVVYCLGTTCPIRLVVKRLVGWLFLCPWLPLPPVLEGVVLLIMLLLAVELLVANTQIVRLNS